MALTNNLLVNLDELEAIRPSQQASLKQTLSVSKVNGRPIFGRTQEDRPRFASFVATTNNRHPLKDSTGSRRYICIQIPDGQMIDNTGEIDYGQLYAQVVYELQELGAPYWFGIQESPKMYPRLPQNVSKTPPFCIQDSPFCIPESPTLHPVSPECASQGSPGAKYPRLPLQYPRVPRVSGQKNSPRWRSLSVVGGGATPHLPRRSPPGWRGLAPPEGRSPPGLSWSSPD